MWKCSPYSSPPKQYSHLRQILLENRMPIRAPTYIDGSRSAIPGPSLTIRPTPSCPPICGSLMSVMGLPSAPAAVPARVCKSRIKFRQLVFPPRIWKALGTGLTNSSKALWLGLHLAHAQELDNRRRIPRRLLADVRGPRSACLVSLVAFLKYGERMTWNMQSQPDMA